MKLYDLVPHELMKQMVDEGFIVGRQHPDLPLTIFNYTETAQFGRVWNEATNLCRGLIVHDDGTIVARPFAKFHNINTDHIPETQVENLPTSAPTITKKLDGSLGIYWEIEHEGEQCSGVASRGSFTSDQAVWASKWEMNQHNHQLTEIGHGLYWPDGFTPVFEIIYDQNRTVCDYDFEGLVLLALVDIETGEEMERRQLLSIAQYNGIKVVERESLTVQEALSRNISNEEGYVLSWPRSGRSPLKVKVKFAEYVALHRIVTGWNPKTVWEILSGQCEGCEESAIWEFIADNKYPLGWRAWLEEVANTLEEKYESIYFEACLILNAARETIEPKYEMCRFWDVMRIDSVKAARRKDYALFFQAQNPKIAGVLFAMYDGADAAPVIWKMIKPRGDKPQVQLEHAA